MAVTNDACWNEAGMDVRYFHYPERNCAQQRNFAIEQAKHDNLLLIDDDVEVDPLLGRGTLQTDLERPASGRDDGQPRQSIDSYIRRSCGEFTGESFMVQSKVLSLDGWLAQLCQTDFQRTHSSRYPASGLGREPAQCDVKHSSLSVVLRTFFTGSSPGKIWILVTV